MNDIKSKEAEEATDKNRRLEYEYESLRREYSALSNKLSDLERSYNNLN